MKLLTPRLELVAATLEIVTADLHQRHKLPALLGAEIGHGWPAPLVDVPAMQWLKNSLANDPTIGGWTAWYWIIRKPRVLIGVSGFKSRPRNGAVEIGYSVLEKYQRRGYASEAVRAMVEWAFANGADCVRAETLPELAASQRLLLKNAFRCAGEGSEPAVIRFERRRTKLLDRCETNTLRSPETLPTRTVTIPPCA